MSYPDANGNIHSIDELVSQTFKCKECHSKFTIAITPSKGQHYHQINHALFLLLVNKETLSRGMEVFNISMQNIYQRIEFFYKQCVHFDQYQLQQNLDNLNGKSLNLSMDRQHFYSNWSDKSDARRTKIVNISTIDNSSRFVLASTLSFDFTSDYEKLKKEFISVGEYSKLQDKRRYPQYVLPEEIDDNNPDLKPPTKHLLLQQTYSTMAHLEYLKMYFNKLKRINLFGDNDSGFEMSITRVCADLIKSKKLTCALLRDSTLEIIDETEKDCCYYWIKQSVPVIERNFLDLKF
jgi:hypothetical protein